MNQTQNTTRTVGILGGMGPATPSTRGMASCSSGQALAQRAYRLVV